MKEHATHKQVYSLKYWSMVGCTVTTSLWGKHYLSESRYKHHMYLTLSESVHVNRRQWHSTLSGPYTAVVAQASQCLCRLQTFSSSPHGKCSLYVIPWGKGAHAGTEGKQELGVDGWQGWQAMRPGSAVAFQKQWLMTFPSWNALIFSVAVASDHPLQSISYVIYFKFHTG